MFITGQQDNCKHYFQHIMSLTECFWITATLAHPYIIDVVLSIYVIWPQLISVCNFFAPRTPYYNFHNMNEKVNAPKPRTDYLKHSFSYSGAILWNNVPDEINEWNSLGFLKRSSHRRFLISTPTWQIIM